MNYFHIRYFYSVIGFLFNIVGSTIFKIADDIIREGIFQSEMPCSATPFIVNWKSKDNVSG